MSTRVTAADLDTDTSYSRDIRDDYAITCDGTAYVSGIAVYANGTHVITIKGRSEKRAVSGVVRYPPPGGHP